MDTDMVDPSLYGVKKLSEICNIMNGLFVPKTHYQDYGFNIPYIRSADIRLGNTIDSRVNIPKEIVEERKGRIFSKGTLLIAATGATMGQVALLGIDAAIDPTVCAVINQWTDMLDNTYLYYFLRSRIATLIGASKKQQRVSSTHLQKLDIALPSLARQQQLVSEISQQLERLDQRIQQLRHRESLLGQQQEDILNKVFAQVAKSASHRSMSIGQLAKVQLGFTPTQSISDYYGDEYVFFKPADTGQQMQMHCSKTRLSAKGFKVARPVKAGSVFFVCAGSLMGKLGISTVDAACNTQMLAIIPLEGVSAVFIYYQLQATAIKQQIEQVAENGTISKEKFEQLQLAILPFNGQLSLVEKIQQGLLGIEQQLVATKQQLQETGDAKDALLKKYF